MHGQVEWATRAMEAYEGCEPDSRYGLESLRRCVLRRLDVSDDAEPQGQTSEDCEISCRRDSGPCGYLLYRNCLFHEAVHQRTCRELRERFGDDEDGFQEEFYDPQQRVEDEIHAYWVDRQFSLAVIRELDRICGEGGPAREHGAGEAS